MKHTLEGHDLSLPAFGPYTKQYMGISHVPAANDGMRFDLSVFAGYYRRRADPPNVRFESGWHPWKAAPDLSFYSYRQELEWKDRVYCEVSFAQVQPGMSVVCAECVNNTGTPQNLVLHWMASVHYPRPSYRNFDVTGAELRLPPSAGWLSALDYEELTFAAPRANDHLTMDGMRRGEEAVPGFVTGYGLGANFGAAETSFYGMTMPCGRGDRVRYVLCAPGPLARPVLGVRYVNPSDQAAVYTLEQTGQTLTLPPCSRPALVWLPCPPAAAGRCELTLTAAGVGAARLDGFVLCEEQEAARAEIRPREACHKPEILQRKGYLILKYPHIAEYYGVVWADGVNTQLRQLLNSELDVFLRETVHDHVHDVLQGDGKGHYTNIFQRPLPLRPRSRRKLYGMVCCGRTAQQAEALCAGFLADRAAGAQRLEALRENAALPPCTPQGEAVRPGIERMAAVLLTNTVYPVYLRGGYIRHNTPGRWWDCLYTWDSGFIGMGLAVLSPRRAFECLNTYLTPPGDLHGAFVHHGSMAPTQFYLYQELRSRTGSRPLAEYAYPRLRQYYEYYTGKAGGSTTASLPGGLLRPWDYFYNSGGWDDYPAQQELHRRHAERYGAPVVTTAHAVCCARILRNAAEELGLPADAAEYEADIRRFAHTLQTTAWNESEGCFDYLLYPDGAPVPMLTEAGRSWNLGLDGLSPLFAGVCTPAQQQRLCAMLADPARYWTAVGLSTVDQSAPYYRSDGYWNGAVWMPYQWLFFKAMLDCGRADFAWQIADTALRLWQNETGESYNCCEHFMVQSGRGAGWHQFGGLSAPVMQWFESYYTPGTLTLGLQGFVHSAVWGEGRGCLRTDVTSAGGTALAVLRPGSGYSARINGAPAPLACRNGTAWELTLPAGRCIIEIGPAAS